MGNRAVITEIGKLEGVYLHWNGGRDSVNAILYYCKHFLVKPQAISNELNDFEFVSRCIGLDPYKGEDYSKLDCDNGDNGVYIIKDYEIVGRMYQPITEQTEYDLIEFCLGIDKEMPKSFQKGKDYILKHFALIDKDSLETDYDLMMSCLKVGQTIFYRGKFWTIKGKNNFDEEKYCNGHEISKAVYFNYTENYEEGDKWKIKDEEVERYNKNPNSYIGYKFRDWGTRDKVIDDENFSIVDAEIYNSLVKKYKDE